MRNEKQDYFLQKAVVIMYHPRVKCICNNLGFSLQRRKANLVVAANRNSNELFPNCSVLAACLISALHSECEMMERGDAKGSSMYSSACYCLTVNLQTA